MKAVSIICVSLFGLLNCSVAAAMSCTLVSAGDSARVCFAPVPLTVARCAHKVLAHFEVARRNNVRFSFSYQASLDGAPLTDEIVVAPGTYPFVANDVSKEAAAYIDIPFKGTGFYEVHVRVFLQGDPHPVDGFSGKSRLTDAPYVRSLVIGISNYDKGKDTPGAPLRNLLFADNDARSFRDILVRLFPDAPQPVLLTSDNKAELPTKSRIISELDQVTDDDSFCNDNDWFIFYFSGHGVVADDGSVVRRYLSTFELDPDRVNSTSLWIGELFPKLAGIGAHNLLIVLDSCFSGTTNSDQPVQSDGSGRSTLISKSIPLGRHSKVLFFERRTSIKAFQNGLPAGDMKDFDRDSIANFKDKEEKLDHSALYLPASNSDHVAEEGRMTFSKGSYRKDEEDADQQSSDDAQTKRTDDQEPPPGHGYYTYVLLSELEQQVPGTYAYPDVLGSHIPWSSGDHCTIDFDAVHTTVRGKFIQMQRDYPDLQRPDLEVMTKNPLANIVCQAAHDRGSQDVSPH